jgi:hypothetical protein
MKRAFGTMMVAAILAASGCEGNISTAPTVADVSAGAPQPPTPEPPADGDAAETAAAPQTEPAAPAAEGGEAPADVPQAGPDVTTEKAAVGVGAKGRDYGGPGFVTTPVQEYFRTGERIAFDIQIPNAMKIYKAEHNNKGPKTHEEYMNIIIQENGVQLPDLPAGEEYFYDPASEQLLVRKPAA